MSEKPIRSHEEFMRRYFPKRYAERKAEGRCVHCGAKRPPNPWAVKVDRKGAA